MSRSTVGVIDYGRSNLYSVCRALEYCGARVELVSRAEDIETQERLILPGVGAFADGMSELVHRGLDQAIRSYSKQNRPLLGICLGMQLLLDESEEFGLHPGLGLISGRVVPISPYSSDGRAHKIPHVGWERLIPPKSEWDSPLFFGIASNTSAYFVHSYSARLNNPQHCAAIAYYDGIPLVAAIQSGLTVGCQFHPEKSGETGLAIISNFLKI